MPIKITLLFLILVGLHSSWAQSPSTDSTTSKPFFSRGSVVHGTYLEYYFSEDADRHISVAQLNTEMAYFIWNRLSVMTNAYLLIAKGQRIVEFKDFDSERYGVGFAGFVRVDLFDFRFHSLFVDLGYGMVFTDKSFPPGGTKWNFTRRYGGGLTIKINPDARLMIGWRHMHISNGKGFGHPRNPAYDSNGLFGGLRFKL
jgi:hypothetical protein